MCTGYGGLDLAAQAVYGGDMGWCAENDAHATVLLHRRFPGVPNVGDLTAVDWRQVPAVDIVTAGFPCQDISYAGPGAGIRKGTRSGLWLTIAEALRLLRPGLVLLENVAALRTRGLATVLGDLAALGYDTAWMCLRASDVGAPHRRDRMFIAAAHPASPRDHAAGPARQRRKRQAAPGQPVRCGMCRPAAHPDGLQRQRRRDRCAPGWAAERGNNPAARCPQRCRTAPADTTCQRRDQGQPEPARLQRRPDPALGGNQLRTGACRRLGRVRAGDPPVGDDPRTLRATTHRDRHPRTTPPERPLRRMDDGPARRLGHRRTRSPATTAPHARQRRRATAGDRGIPRPRRTPAHRHAQARLMTARVQNEGRAEALRSSREDVARRSRRHKVAAMRKTSAGSVTMRRQTAVLITRAAPSICPQAVDKRGSGGEWRLSGRRFCGWRWGCHTTPGSQKGCSEAHESVSAPYGNGCGRDALAAGGPRHQAERTCCQWERRRRSVADGSCRVRSGRRKRGQALEARQLAVIREILRWHQRQTASPATVE